MSRKIKILQVCAVGFTVSKLLLPLINEMNKKYDGNKYKPIIS